MFHTDNQKIGKYLGEQIKRKYRSQRDFGRQYLAQKGEEISEEAINNMANRLSQIINGNKPIQIHELPYFTAMLQISCEQLLSGGQRIAPAMGRETNYSIACSPDPAKWEAYVAREDQPILNADEYGKTVLEYAFEAGNHGFVKFLMDRGYIWFDSGNPKDYILTFGADTSIERRSAAAPERDLRYHLKAKDSLRRKMIALAVEHSDVEMLEKLRAREDPQLYLTANYLFCRPPELNGGYEEWLVQKIARADARVLDYFTKPFQIRDASNNTNGSVFSTTYLYPYISRLLEFLLKEKNEFAETALQRAIRHNEQTYEKLRSLILSVKNDPRYAEEYMQPLWIRTCEQELDFSDKDDIVLFRAIYSQAAGAGADGIVTNLAHVRIQPTDAKMQQKVKQLNESYRRIRDIKEHLQEL